MSAGFDDIQVGLRVRADTSALKDAIRDFDGTAESVERLKTATQSLKGQVNDQVKAIRILNQANRANNFEFLQAIRLLRSVTAVARDLNQVYQTLILRNINTTAVTVAQRQAFEDLSKSAQVAVNALDLLGESNDDVDKAFSDIINKADSLNSTQLKNLISQLEDYGNKANFTAGEQKKFNDELQKLRDLLKEIELKEKNKEFEDFFGGFTNAALAAGSIGVFALKLGEYRKELAAMIGLISKFAPEIGIILALLGGKEFAEATGVLQYAGSPEDLIKPGQINPVTGKPYSFAREGGVVQDQGNYTSIKIDMNNVTLNNDVDLQRLAHLTADAIEKRRALQYK